MPDQTATFVQLVSILLVAWVVLMVPAYAYQRKIITGKAAIGLAIACAIGSTGMYFAFR